MSTITIEYNCHFTRSRHQKKLIAGRKPRVRRKKPEMPSITKLLALAHHYQTLLDDGIMRDYAEIADWTDVSRARITQIMNLLFLAPEIQKAIIDGNVGEVKTERKFRSIAGTLFWGEQAKLTTCI